MWRNARCCSCWPFDPPISDELVWAACRGNTSVETQPLGPTAEREGDTMSEQHAATGDLRSASVRAALRRRATSMRHAAEAGSGVHMRALQSTSTAIATRLRETHDALSRRHAKTRRRSVFGHLGLGR